MVFIGANGFEFENIYTFPTNLTKSINSLTLSSKRFLINIDYTNDSLNTNDLHKITITNDKINNLDTIVLNVCNNIEKIIVYPINIVEGACDICVQNTGNAVNDIISVSVLVLT
tara:strand:- start:746 stop:1087 length:342 start_codon:yes stop_codon:yes gene_type:complete